MRRIGSTLILLTVGAALSACAMQVQNKEDMLAAAGFTLVPANTPQRQASLKTLPPHKFIHQVRNNVVLFVYADPTICDCMYVGNQAAYDRYRANVFQRQIANEQEMTAQMNEMSCWGGWGPGWALLNTRPRQSATTSIPHRTGGGARLVIAATGFGGRLSDMRRSGYTLFEVSE